jgi:hypothetical protein
MTQMTPPASAVIPARGWMALGGAAALVSAVIVGALMSAPQHAAKLSPSGPAAPPAASMARSPGTTPLPDLGGPRSGLVPEVTLPVGARPYAGKEPVMPGFEFWEVPASHRDLVAEMGSELPTGAPFNGMPWCGEVVDTMTSWAWGSPAETIGVSLIDGGVMITRLPEPHGCHP